MKIAELCSCAEKVLSGGEITPEEGERLITLPDTDTPLLLALADKIRQHFCGDAVSCCAILNSRSGSCPEDCRFCAQSSHYQTNIQSYPLLDKAAILDAAKKAKELGKTVVLDPAPAVPDLPEELYPCLDLIKPNETELSILTGRPFSLETLGDSARLLRQRGARNVLVTLGAEGSYLLEEDGRETRIPGDKTVQAVDTTAAGDSYLAGVCVALSQGKGLPQAAALASAVASLVVTRRGAQTSIPDREELRALLQQLDQ